MSAMNVYWLLMLDSVVAVSVTIAVISFMLTIVTGTIWVSAKCDGNAPDIARVANRWVRVSTVLLVVSTLLATFVPNTKQAAIIFLAPKIANSEFVNGTLPTEAKELYGLAKTWLRDQVNKEEKK